MKNWIQALEQFLIQYLFQNFLIKSKNSLKMKKVLIYIKEEFKGNEKLIENFKNFSYVYGSIIDLNHNL